MPVAIVGTASDDNFLRYRLEFGSVDAVVATVVGVGTAPVVNGVLGQVDPTLLENGLYRARLIVEDVNGQMAVDERVYRVTGEAKIGLMALSFVDLHVPVSGIPITVMRLYDSRVKESRDFGVGWSLDIRTGKYRNNRPPGQGWIIQDQPFLDDFLPCIGGALETRSHFTEVRLSDREFYLFALTLSGSNLGITGACEATASFRFIDGTRPGATLDILDGTSVIYLRGGDETLLDMNSFLDGAGVVYDPRHVRLTTPDGRKITFDGLLGITRIEDLNTNTLAIGPGGIVHSSGKSIAFERDASGRIVRITDTAGKQLTYSYDGSGDLVEFIDRLSHRTTFTYDSRHNLLEIRDPVGNRAVRHEYDAAGRLIAVIDPGGNRMELTHDLGTRREVIRNRLGHVTVHEYDEAGNVVALVDALGNRRTFTYDGDGNQLSETDPLGRTQAMTYDSAGNLLSRRDFDGNLTTFTYDARNQLLTTTDAEERVTTLAYDARGNLVRTVDSNGAATGYTADSAGRAIAARDPLGHTMRFSYDAAGNLASLMDPLGQTVHFTYDGAGNQLSATRLRTGPDGSRKAETSIFAYDEAGDMLAYVDPLGNATRYSYDFAGSLTSMERGGAARRIAYDDTGRLVRTESSSGQTTTATYDAEGRRLSQTDSDGRTTRYEYDALGRLTTTIGPDGSEATIEYDAAGRPVRNVDAAGNATRYSYESNLQRVTDAMGQVTSHRFDSQRRRIETVDALGRSTRFEYDGNGDPTRLVRADGSTTTATYDPNRRPASVTDPARRTIRFTYDAASRLQHVIDPLGTTTAYEYDEADNPIIQTDPAGRVTRREYDAIGRLVRRIRPLGQSERFAYDARHNLTSYTAFDGRVTTYAYDFDNRLVRKSLPDGSVVDYAYTPGGRRLAAGRDHYEYDDAGRLVRDIKANGEAIEYTYDVRGNRTSIRTAAGIAQYTYDALNRLSTVTDGTGTTTFEYDAVGNLASRRYPNGVVVTYAYDSLNRLIALTNTGPSGVISSYTYTLAPDGRRTHVSEIDPSGSSRTVDYAYDAAGRLITEIIDAPDDSDDRQITYVYDAVGNRVRKTVVANTGTTDTIYAYDDNDRLLTETSTIALASSDHEDGLPYVLAGYRFSPVLAALAALGMCWRRRSDLDGGAARRLWAKSFVVFLLIASGVFGPGASHRAIADLFGTRVVDAQTPVETVIAYAYDENGNTISRSDGLRADTYAYDAENRLVAADIQLGPQAGLVSHTYDADGNRTSKTDRGVTTEYLVDKNRELAQVLAETSGTAVVSYTYGLDLLSQTRPTGGTSFYLYDGFGSVRQLTDASGAVTDTYTYDAFGNVIEQSGASPNVYLYRGEQLDPNVGFYYLRARYYAPAVGRFLTTDPFAGNFFDPPSLHRYLYAGADPVNAEDPTGRFTLVELGVTVAIIGVGAAIGYATLGGVGGAIAGAAIGAAVVLTRGLILRLRAAQPVLNAVSAEEQLASRALIKEAQRRGMSGQAVERLGQLGTQAIGEARVESGIVQLSKKTGWILALGSLEAQEARAESVKAETVAESGEDGSLAIELFVLYLEFVALGLPPPGNVLAEKLAQLLR